MDHNLVSIPLSKGVESICVVTMRLSKNRKNLYLCKIKIYKVIGWIWKMCYLSITLFKFSKLYKILLNNGRKPSIHEMFFKARNFLHKGFNILR